MKLDKDTLMTVWGIIESMMLECDQEISKDMHNDYKRIESMTRQENMRSVLFRISFRIYGDDTRGFKVHAQWKKEKEKE